MNTTSNNRSTLRRLAAGFAEGWNDFSNGQRRQVALNMPWAASQRKRKSHQR